MKLRDTIYTCIYDILYNHKFLDNVLQDKVFSQRVEDFDNANYIKRVVSGVLENKILLEYILNKYSKIKTTKLDKNVFTILICAIYEIIFMDSSKNYAVVNEAVELSKHKRCFYYHKYINAILRKVCKNEHITDIFSNQNIPFNIKYSIPDNLYNYLFDNINMDVCDREKVKLLKQIFLYFYENDNICFRVNSNKENIILDELKSLNISCYVYDKSLKLKYLKAIVANKINNLNKINAFNKVSISIQDISSIYYIDRLYDIINTDLPHNVKVLDACSSPGGKTFALCHIDTKKQMSFVCCDRNEYKLIKLNENIIREKNTFVNNNIHIMVNDATKINDKFVNAFNLVLLDVPCSNLGVISKRQDVKYNFDENRIDDLIKIQKQMLYINKNYVKNNSYLSYSTCTINKKENDLVINDFLNNNKEFSLVYKEQILPTKQNMSDGFFFCIMKKNEKFI